MPTPSRCVRALIRKFGLKIIVEVISITLIFSTHCSSTFLIRPPEGKHQSVRINGGVTVLTGRNIWGFKSPEREKMTVIFKCYIPISINLLLLLLKWNLFF